MMSQKLIIFGYGGHARSAADLALACGYISLLFVDENARPGESFLGHSVVSSLATDDFQEYSAFPAAGDNKRRSQQCLAIEQLGLPLVSLVSPLASVGVGSSIGAGCFVGHHAHIGPLASIATGCIVNTGAVVEHEAQVGEYAHISVNSTIAGRSSLGAYSMLGAGAVIIDGVSVASGVMVGAGGVVHRSIVEPGIYTGVPARKSK